MSHIGLLEGLEDNGIAQLLERLAQELNIMCSSNVFSGLPLGLELHIIYSDYSATSRKLRKIPSAPGKIAKSSEIWTSTFSHLLTLKLLFRLNGMLTCLHSLNVLLTFPL